MQWLGRLVIFVVMLSSAAAHADDGDEKYLFSFSVKEVGGKPACQKTRNTKPTAKSTYIKVDKTAAGKLTFIFNNISLVESTSAQGADFQEFLIPLTDDELLLQVKVADGVEKGKCEAPVKLSKKSSLVVANNDNGQQGKKLAHPTPPENLQYLFHTSQGQPDFPLPARLTEGQQVQVVLSVLPGDKSRTFTLQVDNCSDVSSFRTDIPDKATAVKNTKQADEPSDAYIGQYFTCAAGVVTYTIKEQVTDDAGKVTDTTLSATKITFRPKYHIAAVALAGWDSAQRTTYAADLRAGYTSPVIARRREKVGVAEYVGATWMIGGVDYEEMHWYNYFANVFIAVDPASPTKDVVAGLSITPTGGAAISLGLSFHEGQVLEGLVRGSPVALGTTFPQHSSWNERGAGLFVGLSVDSRVYNALVAQFSKP
jgi:hypothetical protein